MARQWGGGGFLAIKKNSPSCLEIFAEKNGKVLRPIFAPQGKNPQHVKIVTHLTSFPADMVFFFPFKIKNLLQKKHLVNWSTGKGGLWMVVGVACLPTPILAFCSVSLSIAIPLLRAGRNEFPPPEPIRTGLRT